MSGSLQKRVATVLAPPMKGKACDRVCSLARALNEDSFDVLLTYTQKTIEAEGPTEKTAFECIYMDDCLHVIRCIEGAHFDRSEMRWLVPAKNAEPLKELLSPLFKVMVCGDTLTWSENPEHAPDARFSPKVFSLLDRSVCITEREVSGILAAEHQSLRVHDGNAFIPFPVKETWTRYPFLVVRTGNDTSRYHLLNTLTMSVVETEDGGTFRSDGLARTFAQAHRGLRHCPVFREEVEEPETQIFSGIQKIFSSSMKRIRIAVPGIKVALIPSCWAMFDIPEMTNPDLQRIWVDAMTWAWVATGYPEFFGALSRKLGYEEGALRVMISEMTLFSDSMTEDGKVNTLLHELAHHLHLGSGKTDEDEPHLVHGFWFHVAFCVLLVLVHGRTHSVLNYIARSMNEYADEDADWYDVVPFQERSCLAMEAADRILRDASREGLSFASLQNAFRIVMTRDGYETDEASVASCVQSLMTRDDWEPDDPEILNEFAT